MKNTLKVLIIFFFLGFLIYIIFKKIHPAFSFFVILFVIFFLYFFSDRIILLKYGSGKIKNKYIENVVEELSKKAGIRKPKIYLAKIDIANIFVVGKSKEDSSIGITKKLLKNFSKKEKKAAIAYAIACIKNDTVLLGSIVAILTGAIVSVAHFLKYFFDLLTTRKSKIGLSLFSVVMAIAALFLHLTISTKDKFKADLKASKLLGQPYSLVEVIKKMDKEKAEGFEWSSHLFMVSPLTKYSGVLFSVHPPVRERIRRLRKFWRKKRKDSIFLPKTI